MGIFRDLAPFAIALGAIAFAAFAVPLACAAAAVGRGIHLGNKWAKDWLVWAFIAGAVISGYICYDVAESARTRCEYLQTSMNNEGLLPSLTSKTFTQQYFEECR